MSIMMIPDSLKLALRNRYKSHPDDDGEFSETAMEHEWTVKYCYSEWSGYHDESNYYSYSTTVLDHEPVLSDNQEWHRVETPPDIREWYTEVLQGYDIVDIYKIHKSCGYPEYYSKTIIKIDCTDSEYQYTRPLWIMAESNKSR